MRHTPLITLLVLGLSAPAPVFALADAPPSSTKFHCTFRDIDNQTGATQALELVREVKPCGGDQGGFCFVPIDHLKTPVSCRDFTASFALDDTPPTLDVTLWSYCGDAGHAQHPVSQTASLPIDANHFQLTAEWDGYLSVLVCDRL